MGRQGETKKRRLHRPLAPSPSHGISARMEELTHVGAGGEVRGAWES